MIDIESVIGKVKKEQTQEPPEPPEPPEPQEPPQEQVQDSPQEQVQDSPQALPQEQEQEQASPQEQEQEQEQNGDTLFNGMSYVDVLTTIIVCTSLAMLVITRSVLSSRIFFVSIGIALLAELLKSAKK